VEEKMDIRCFGGPLKDFFRVVPLDVNNNNVVRLLNNLKNKKIKKIEIEIF